MGIYREQSESRTGAQEDAMVDKLAAKLKALLVANNVIAGGLWCRLWMGTAWAGLRGVQMMNAATNQC